MTAHQLNVQVPVPGDPYTSHRVVLKPTAATLGREWDVYHGGELVGTVRRRRYTPHTNYPGTRIRKDLAPRTVWDAYRTHDRTERTRNERRNDALFFIIKERVQ